MAQNKLLSTDDLFIKQVRGKYVISSMPKHLVFGIPGTLLECQQCMDNATWRGVLIGACQECALKYNSVYTFGKGYEKKEQKEILCDPSTAPFGFYTGFSYVVCEKINEILGDDSNLPKEPRYIKTNEAYSFYDLASLPKMEFSLMLDTRSAVTFFAERYHIKPNNYNVYEGPRYSAIISAIYQLRNIFNTQNKEFYTKCEKMEKEWIMCHEANTQKEVLEKNEKNEEEKEQCYYCGNVKPLKACGKCKNIKYCSIACQSRDWSKGGAYACMNGDVSAPHKESCEYLNGLRLEQERYDEVQQANDEDDVNDELDREAGAWWVGRS